jgi:hypothetical protein
MATCGVPRTSAPRAVALSCSRSLDLSISRHRSWVETKERYPEWQPGIREYRPAPSRGLGERRKSIIRRGTPASAQPASDKHRGTPDERGGALPWDGYDPIIEKDNAAMLDAPLPSKLAFQRLKNVFQVRRIPPVTLTLLAMCHPPLPLPVALPRA